MDKGLTMGVTAMRAAEARLEVIAANLANLSAPAYKRQASATEVFTLQRGGKRVEELQTRAVRDFSQGLIERRDDPFALALDGDGFFAVETPTGEAYTRNGGFRLNDQGDLLTIDGFPVAWSGARGRVQPTGEALTIDASGGVHQGASTLGALKLVTFADKQALQVDADGYFRMPETVERQPATAEVHQFATERSNAESVDELVALIKAQRSYDTSASILRTIDQSFRRLNQSR